MSTKNKQKQPKPEPVDDSETTENEFSELETKKETKSKVQPLLKSTFNIFLGQPTGYPSKNKRKSRKRRRRLRQIPQAKHDQKRSYRHKIQESQGQNLLDDHHACELYRNCRCRTFLLCIVSTSVKYWHGEGDYVTKA
jgi:hypothetical protein